MAGEIKYRQCILSVRFTSFFFPFDTLQFVNHLEKNGFVIDDKIANAPFGARIEISGFIGRKANTSVRLETDRQVVAVHTPSPSAAIENLTLIENFVAKDMDVSLEGRISHYEFVANSIISAGVSPIDAWAKHFECDPIFHEVGEALGSPVAPYGMKFSGTGMIPDSPDWFEIAVSPLISAPTEKHLIDIVFRNHNRDFVLDFVRRSDRFLKALLNIVEK